MVVAILLVRSMYMCLPPFLLCFIVLTIPRVFHRPAEHTAMDAAAAHTKEIIDRELKATTTASSSSSSSSSAIFNPVDLGLDASFTLTDFSALKGCGCKLPQAKLLGYLEDIANDLKPNETPGMDSSVVKIGHGKDLYMISTTDFFFPSVEDPYVQVHECFCPVARG